MPVRILKPVLLSIAAVVACWVLVFIHWRNTARIPSGADIVIWLLVAPGALLLAWWGGKALWRSVGADAAGAVQSATAAPDTRSTRSRSAAASAAGQTDAAEARFKLAVLGSSLRTPHGTDVAELVVAMGEGKGPQPDPELRNDAGFPIFASRMAALEIDALREQLRGLPLATSGEIDPDTLVDERLRTVQSMSEVLVDLLSRAAGQAASQRRVSLLLPAWWQEQERLMAAQWLQTLSVQQDPTHAWRFDHFGASPGADAWTLLDRINLALHREPATSALWIVLAGESAISASRVGEWEAGGVLHRGDRRPGLIPGEAAAGLLLTAAIDPVHAGADAVLLSRPAFGELASSADATRISTASTLAALTDRLIAAADLKIDAVRWTVSDTDHRASRVTEFTKLMLEKLPHVPLDSNNFFVGAACGHMGVAADLVGIAVASHVVADRQQAALVASLHEPRLRVVVLVSPPPARSAG